jgi:MoaA/NifB/PqqE/SkfB family radical SAM enzyme
VDLLDTGPIREIALDLTSRCNLRCTYCAVSLPTYAGQDMDPEIIEAVTAGIIALSRHNDVRHVILNGHGETTILPNWVQVASRFHELDMPTAFTTNLSKELSHDELECLARFSAVTVSVDTADRDLLRSIRRSVDINRIIGNIVKIRAAAALHGHRPPEINLSVGIYDRNVPTIRELASVAVALKIATIQFWYLVEYPDSDSGLRALENVPAEELAPLLDQLAEALDLLRNGGVNVMLLGDKTARLLEDRAHARC